MTTVLAPGKIVLWGEYAVLAGAPAGVMALNTPARVSMRPSDDERWHFTSQGFVTSPLACSSDTIPDGQAAGFVAAILTHWAHRSLAECGEAQSISTDSSAFFQAGQKLGLGSSASVCAATYRLLCEVTRRPANYHEVMEIHRQWQGGKGSGLDVASVWHGGLIHFQDGDAKPAALPADLHWQIIFSGKSAGTADHIGSFDQWRKNANTSALNELILASERLCTAPDLDSIALYCHTLRRFDNAANLNIFTPEHIRLGTLAAASGVHYKPCGAGGGDIGIGFSDDPEALALFRQQAEHNGFLPLDLEMASHGIALKHG